MTMIRSKTPSTLQAVATTIARVLMWVGLDELLDGLDEVSMTSSEKILNFNT